MGEYILEIHFTTSSNLNKDQEDTLKKDMENDFYVTVGEVDPFYNSDVQITDVDTRLECR